MLELDDIQHILLTRAPALTGRYEFLSFRNAGGGTRVAGGYLEKVQSAAAMRASVDEENRWVTRGLHLERVAGARRGRGVAGYLSRRVQAGDGRPRRDPRRHGRESSGSLGRRIGRARTSTRS